MTRRTTSLPAIVVGALGLLAAAQPAGAFHGSELDPATKQHLAGIIDRLEHACAAGDRPACAQKEQVRAVGNGLAVATRSCAAGDRMACRTLSFARARLGSAMPMPAPSAAGAYPPGGGAVGRPYGSPGGGGVVLGNPYDWRSHLPRRGGVVGNPYDWRSYGTVTGNPYDTGSYGRGGVVGNPYDTESYNTRVAGNPYDWRSYERDE